MTRLVVVLGAAMAVLLGTVAPAAADGPDFRCNSTTPITGNFPDDVIVPEDGVCILENSTVGDDVEVGRNAYFEASNTQVDDSVRGRRSLTIFLHDQSSVGGELKARDTFQVLIYNSTLDGRIDVEDTGNAVQICGNTVDGRVHVEDSVGDILIGHSAAAECLGNTITRGDLIVEDNFAIVELSVRENRILEGDLEVLDNEGDVPKEILNNVGGDDLECEGNDPPVVASGNTGWDEIEGQCEQPVATSTDAPEARVDEPVQVLEVAAPVALETAEPASSDTAAPAE